VAATTSTAAAAAISAGVSAAAGLSAGATSAAISDALFAVSDAAGASDDVCAGADAGRQLEVSAGRGDADDHRGIDGAVRAGMRRDGADADGSGSFQPPDGSANSSHGDAGVFEGAFFRSGGRRDRLCGAGDRAGDQRAARKQRRDHHGHHHHLAPVGLSSSKRAGRFVPNRPAGSSGGVG